MVACVGNSPASAVCKTAALKLPPDLKGEFRRRHPAEMIFRSLGRPLVIYYPCLAWTKANSPQSRQSRINSPTTHDSQNHLLQFAGRRAAGGIFLHLPDGPRDVGHPRCGSATA